ncbi:MAG TPA: hypothetical protein VFY45_01330 [Baekduia sp.]|nr:hypothetical protein [Baekduia sp.]
MGTTRSEPEAGPQFDAPVRDIERASARSVERRAESVLWAILVAFGAAIALGILITLIKLIGMGHPAPNFGYYVYDDALQMYEGHWPYQDPSVGYVGLLYPPLHTALLAGLMHIHLWSGWGPVVHTLAQVALAGIVASVAYRRDSVPSAKALRVLEAIAFGLVAGWLISSNPSLGPNGAGPDLVAWALGLGGILLVQRGLNGSRRALIWSIVLLSAAFWSKQPALAAAMAATCWAVLAAVLGVTTWRRAAGFIAALAAVNLVVFGALMVATHGWLFFYMYELGSRHNWGTRSYWWIIERAWPWFRLELAFAAVLLVPGAIGWARGRRVAAPRRLRSLAADQDAQTFAILLIFLVIATTMETFFQRKQGADLEHLLGPLWALMLMAALAWRCAGRTARTRFGAGLLLGGLAFLGLGTGGPANTGLRLPELVTVEHYRTWPQPLEVLSSHGYSVLEQRFGDAGVQDGIVPPNYSTCDMTAAGLPVTGLERELAERRWLVVVPIGTLGGYCSGYGKWEERYFWKINRLIAVGYQIGSQLPYPLLVRQAGPAVDGRLQELLHCFAPYRLAGVLFRIGHGGGFWCQATWTTPRLRLGDIPSPRSQLLTDGTVTSLEGSLVITMPKRAGSVEIGVTKPARDRVLARFDAGAPGAPNGMVVTAGAVRGRAAQTAVARGAQVVRIDPDAVRGGRLSIYATVRSKAAFDFSGMTIHTKNGILRGAVTRRGLPGYRDR